MWIHGNGKKSNRPKPITRPGDEKNRALGTSMSMAEIDEILAPYGPEVTHGG